MSEPAFDPSPYVRPPILNIASGISLGSAIVVAMPKGVPPNVKKAARLLRECVVVLKEGWQKRDKTSPKQARVTDLAVDNAWGGLQGRLINYSNLPPEFYPLAPRAGELLLALFPDGLRFTQLKYAEEWAESQKRLDRIQQDGLADDLDRLAGPEFLAEVRRTHAIYGQVLGITKPQELPEDVEMLGPLRELQAAITNYAIKVVALAEADDPSSLQMVRAALAPIDAHRAAAASRRAGAENATPEPIDEKPVPDLPA